MRFSVAHGAALALEPWLDIAEVEANAAGAQLQVGESALHPVVDGPEGKPEAGRQGLLVDVGTGRSRGFGGHGVFR